MTESELLRSEVRYVSHDGKPVTTTLREARAVDVVVGSPVRRMRSHAGQRHRPGFFWSATTGSLISFESQLELNRLWLADFAADVTGIASQPFWLSGGEDGVLRKHVPDLLLRRQDGSFVVVDVKPAEFASRPEVMEVFEWTSRACRARGWGYEVWTGGDPLVLRNVRWLGQARRSHLIDPAAVVAVDSVVRSGWSLGAICERAAVQIPVERVRAACLAQLWTGRWSTDLGKTLSAASTITLEVGHALDN